MRACGARSVLESGLETLARPSTWVSVFVIFVALFSGAHWAVGQAPGEGERRNLDARRDHNRGFPSEGPTSLQLQAVDSFRAGIPDLVVTYDQTTGATRSLLNPLGYLTGRNTAADPLDLALDFVISNHELLGLEAADLSDYEVTDRVYSNVTGSTHVYLRQRYGGLAVYNGQLQIHVNREGRITSVNNAFLPDLRSAVTTLRPSVSARGALARAARHLAIDYTGIPLSMGGEPGPEQTTRMIHTGISRELVEARLMFLPVRRGDARLVWGFQIHTPDEEHAYDFTVDAVSGDIWTRSDWIQGDRYRVFARPAESPNHTASPPPADGRILVVDPADSTASPLGWHDTGSSSFTIMRGNNVHAYQDQDANNAPPGSEPSCGGSLVCDFPVDFTLGPANYTNAAIANLFYWNNIIHDIQYQYGFDEAAGNFQVNNFGKGGAGGGRRARRGTRRRWRQQCELPHSTRRLPAAHADVSLESHQSEPRR